jgi:hypothetical protein
MSPGVSEADLLSVLDKRARHAQLEPGGRLHRHAGDKRHLGLTAGELMTSPAITIHPDATLSAAARLMNSRHLKRLLGRLGAAQRQVPPPESWPRLAGIESIQAFEAPKRSRPSSLAGTSRGVGVQLTATARGSARIRFRRSINAYPRGILVRPFGAGQDRHRRRGGTAHP